MKNKRKSSDKKDVISPKYTRRVAGVPAISVLSSGHPKKSELSFMWLNGQMKLRKA